MMGEDRFSFLSRIFSPVFPGFITAGLCAGFSALLTQIFPSLEGCILIRMLNLVNEAFSTYIPVYTGWQAARVFGGDAVLGALLAMVTMMDDISVLSSFLPDCLSFLIQPGAGGVLASIAGAYVLSRLEKSFSKVIKPALNNIFTPLLSFLVVLIPYVFILMPFFSFISQILCSFVSFLFSADSVVIRLVAGYFCAFIFLPVNLIGLNYAFVALYLVQLEESGSISLYPVLAMAGASQVGMAVAVMLKSGKAGRNDLRNIAASGIIPGLLGVGAPLMYGVSLLHSKLFLCACAGAGFAGSFIALTSVASTGWGPSGLLAIPLMTAGNSSPLMSVACYVAGLGISFICGFIITCIFVRGESLSSLIIDGHKQDGVKDTRQA